MTIKTYGIQTYGKEGVQEQPANFIGLIGYIIRSILGSERNWTSSILKLEVSFGISNICAVNSDRPSSASIPTTKPSTTPGRLESTTSAFSLGQNLSPFSTTLSSTTKAAPTPMQTSSPASSTRDQIGLDTLTTPDTDSIYLICPGDFTSTDSRAAGICLGEPAALP